MREAGRAADLVGDGHVDRFPGTVGGNLRRLARAADDPARVVTKVRLAVAECGEVGNEIDVLAHALDRRELLRNLIARPGLLRNEDGVVPTRPQNQVPNRTGNAAPFAYAVPLSLRKQSRIGKATATTVPFNMPRSTWRRLRFL